MGLSEFDLLKEVKITNELLVFLCLLIADEKYENEVRERLVQIRRGWEKL